MLALAITSVFSFFKPKDVILKQTKKTQGCKVARTYFMGVGHVFESYFSAGTTYAISMIFGILGQEWWNLLLLLMLFIFL